MESTAFKHIDKYQGQIILHVDVNKTVLFFDSIVASDKNLAVG